MTNLLISSRIDRATGIYLEHKRHSPIEADILGRADFWFAYPPDATDNPFAGAPGASAAEAIAKLLAKRPDLRRAA